MRIRPSSVSAALTNRVVPRGSGMAGWGVVAEWCWALVSNPDVERLDVAVAPGLTERD